MIDTLMTLDLGAIRDWGFISLLVGLITLSGLVWFVVNVLPALLVALIGATVMGLAYGALYVFSHWDGWMASIATTWTSVVDFVVFW